MPHTHTHALAICLPVASTNTQNKGNAAQVGGLQLRSALGMMLLCSSKDTMQQAYDQKENSDTVHLLETSGGNGLCTCLVLEGSPCKCRR